MTAEYVNTFPTKNDAYPRLTDVPTAQWTFLDNAPFFNIMEESSPVVSVVAV